MTLDKIQEYLASGMLTKSEAIELLNKNIKSDTKLEEDIHTFLFTQGRKSWKN